MNKEIPKIIHQIWIGPKTPPWSYINTWKEDYMDKNPEYEYHLWNNDSIKEVLDKFPKIKKIYNIEKTWHGKADMLRYMIVYLYGGIYIDADSVWINDKSLNGLIEESKDTLFFSGIYPRREYLNNAVFGCIKESPVILFVLNTLRKYTVQSYRKMRSHYDVWKVTGPLLLNHVRSKYKITSFPSYYFYPINWFHLKDIQYHKNNDVNKNSYMFHYGMTTNKLDVK